MTREEEGVLQGRDVRLSSHLHVADKLTHSEHHTPNGSENQTARRHNASRSRSRLTCPISNAPYTGRLPHDRP